MVYPTEQGYGEFGFEGLVLIDFFEIFIREIDLASVYNLIEPSHDECVLLFVGFR